MQKPIAIIPEQTTGVGIDGARVFGLKMVLQRLHFYFHFHYFHFRFCDRFQCLYQL